MFILGRDGLRLRQGFGGHVRAVPFFSLLRGKSGRVEGWKSGTKMISGTARKPSLS